MLPQKNRIRKKSDFQNILKKGKAFFCPLFVVKVKKNNLEFSRFAFIISKKTEKKAVKRNRIRRLFREVIKEIMPFISENIDVVFIIKNNKIDDVETIKKQVEKALKTKLND